MTTHLTATGGADEFYPTPDGLAWKMLCDVDWRRIDTVLEPSAGKGNLVEFTLRKNHEKRHFRHSQKEINIDCIEIDPHLRQILKYNFSKDENANVRIIHDDFLTYHSVKRYDLIVMNPPFSNGDMHLLKALEVQKDGGEIVCLLNAETVRNLCTNSRQILWRELNRHGAKITYHKDEFTGAAGAERTADVEVAIIKISIPRAQEKESEFWERMKKAQEREKIEKPESTELTLTGFLENIIAMYNVEISASVKLIEEYHALKPYISREFPSEKTSRSTQAILTLTVGTDGNSLQECDVNKYLKKVRLKYWEALFSNEQFTGNLTSNLQDRYMKMVSAMADYDFTMFNIQTILAEMNSEMAQGVKETILALFDKLSAKHAYYPECQNNIHLYDGWKTNKAHYVNRKVIIPTNGMFSTYSWDKDKSFSSGAAYRVLSDIEKVFNYLDGGQTPDIDLDRVLDAASKGGQTRGIPCKYFEVSLFKKGTTHIKFGFQHLVDKLNIYAGRGYNWLPPSYGKKHYAEMDADEKTAVDNFQGETEYAKVMAAPEFYLFDASTAILAIEQKTEI
jgi:predicted RNA methylase